MSPRPVRTIAVAVAASLAAAAPAAAQDEVRGFADAARAAVQDPLEFRGIRADNAAGGGVTITFTSRAAALHRRVAGLRAIVRCQAVVPNGPLLIPLDRAGELFADTRTPRARRTLRIRHAPGTTFDVCQFAALRGTKRVRSLTLPLTPAGAAYLDAKRVSDRLVAAMLVASALGPDGHYPAAADVVVPGLVVLAAPTDSPPAGRVGLYSDAAQHLTVVALTAAGQRLYIDANGGVLTTNVAEVVLARR